MIPYVFKFSYPTAYMRREVHTLVSEIKSIMSISDAIWHREDGPAWIEYYASGDIKLERYYINDKLLTRKEFEKWQLIRDLSLEVIK